MLFLRFESAVLETAGLKLEVSLQKTTQTERMLGQLQNVRNGCHGSQAGNVEECLLYFVGGLWCEHDRSENTTNYHIVA
uniref:Uncharacterized protein n=1 Tax=Anguilla anguilla TaxID=7936 RepID=A0A0E9VKX0_ANGAN